MRANMFNLNHVYLTVVHLIHSCGKVHKSLSNGKVGVVQNRLEWNYCAAEGIIALGQSTELSQSCCTLHEKCKTGVFGLQSGFVVVE